MIWQSECCDGVAGLCRSLPATFRRVFYPRVSYMKRSLWMVLLALALPVSAFAAKSVYFGNTGGTLSGSSAGLNLTGSELVVVNGLNPSNGLGQVAGELGNLTFTTGGL